jgi:hypothetical protein
VTCEWDTPEFLVHTTITGGIGLSTIGVDRGEVGPSLLCRADRRGDAVVVTALNTAFGHSGTSDGARAAAARSFASSALARCAVTGPDTFDAAPLGTLDLVGAARLLTDAAGTGFALDPELSGVVQARRYGDALALDAVLTFRPDRPEPQERSGNGHSPRSTRPGPLGFPAPTDTVTVHQQVVLRPLPSPGYRPAPLDPTIGAMPHLTVHRFDRIDEQDAETALATRFRLDGAPVVFHLDPGMPAPIRDAVLAGGNWWQEAFAAAGFTGAYRVEPLPDGADLDDPRRNVVLWVHRADRGWSYGMTQVDPRTGEILRGVVRLGSQRVEQLRAITEAVLAPYAAGGVGAAGVRSVVDARMRQLAAHEIGHALGLAHNFASHAHDAPSVMDYPGPIFDLDADGRPAATRPYATGLGPWDLRQIAALYGDAPPVESEPSLYITDADARLDDAADACGATWIAPSEPVEALQAIVDVRAAALARFGPGVVPPGSDSNEIERRFLLLYLLHRHQATAVAKLVAGVRRRYARTTGDGFDGAATPVPAKEQAAAVAQLKLLLEPDFLEVPSQVRPVLVGPSGGRGRREGQFDHRTAGAFDVAAAVAAGTDLVGRLLLAPARLNRIVSQSRAVLDDLVAATAGRALDLLEAPERTEVTEVIGWTLLRRFEESLAAPGLHHHARVAVLEAASAGPRVVAGLERPAVRTRWAALEKAAFEHAAELAALPLGAPI